MTDSEKLHDSIIRLKTSRRLSIEASHAAILAMLAALEKVLDGERLRGLPNLGGSTDPLYAAPVRAKAGSHTRAPLNVPDKMLVLTERGELFFARPRDGGGGWALNSPREDELHAEDAEKLANTIGEVIAKHCRLAERSSRRFDSIERFAKRIYDVCEFED